MNVRSARDRGTRNRGSPVPAPDVPFWWRPARLLLRINVSLTRLPDSAGHRTAKGEAMSDVVGIPGNRIRSFVERIEQIENEIKELNEAKKEVFSEAKGEGFDVKILKEIIKLRRQDQDERDEHESLLDVYMRAMDEAGPAPVAEAA